MANETSNSGVEQLRRDLEDLRADMQRLGADLRSAARARVQDGLAVAQEFGKDAARQAEAVSREARHQVAEHPGAAIATAFGIGLTIGLLIGRPRS